MPAAHFHVVCGGGTGSQLLRRLHERGFGLSAGALAENDDDAKTASELGVEVVIAPMSGSFEPSVAARLHGLLLRSTAVILTPFAVGRGNLPNLETVLGLPADLPILIVRGGDFGRRDYTGGAATRIYGLLRSRALATSGSSEELVRVIVDRFAPASDPRPGA